MQPLISTRWLNLIFCNSVSACDLFNRLSCRDYALPFFFPKFNLLTFVQIPKTSNLHMNLGLRQIICSFTVELPHRNEVKPQRDLTKFILSCFSLELHCLSVSMGCCLNELRNIDYLIRIIWNSWNIEALSFFPPCCSLLDTICWFNSLWVHSLKKKKKKGGSA